MGRSPCEENGLKKGPWTPDEDEKLVKYIQKHGLGSWRALPQLAGLNRCGKSCRLRWTNYLRPDIKRGKFSEEEEQTILHLHSILGNKWSTIATRLPGRTDNEIKNFWNTHLKKKLIQMGFDPMTHQPRTDLFSSLYHLIALANLRDQYQNLVDKQYHPLDLQVLHNLLLQNDHRSIASTSNNINNLNNVDVADFINSVVLSVNQSPTVSNVSQLSLENIISPDSFSNLGENYNISINNCNNNNNATSDPQPLHHQTGLTLPHHSNTVTDSDQQVSFSAAQPFSLNTNCHQMSMGDDHDHDHQGSYGFSRLRLDGFDDDSAAWFDHLPTNCELSPSDLPNLIESDQHETSLMTTTYSTNIVVDDMYGGPSTTSSSWPQISF